MLTTDNREHHRRHELKEPYFGAAPEALLQGFASLSQAEIHIIACTQRPMRSPSKLADNIHFHSLHVPKLGWLRTGYQGCIRATRKVLRELRPDIVHGQGTERDCAISAVFSDYPNVITIHGNMAELARRFRCAPGSYAWLAARLEDLTLRRTSGVFCNSVYTEELVHLRTRQTWRVSNSIRKEFFVPQAHPSDSSNRPLLLCIGEIIPRKRPLEILNVAQRLWQQGGEFRLRFVGRASLESRYAARFIDQLKAAPNARYLGEQTVEELVSLLDSASALIHFPSEEAFGLVVAEALARNLKLFASRTGGIPDIATGVEGTELFRVDDFDSLERATGHWLKAGAPRSATAASSISQLYKPERIAHRHVEIYREVLTNFS